MAASKAPTANTTNVSSTSTSSTTTDNIEHNFHELCRSCGKTNAELYDLFQTTNSPFSTSSTTCYTHLNNCNFTSSSSSSRTSSATATTATATNNQTSASTIKATSSTAATAAGCTKSSSRECLTTFDSVAATAKATAKGQSNMDNILQEMQIWQLLIKCNDGLPQRICAKCTAQFYMIHKFRRKCLKVQTQLRALFEEQQQQQLEFCERQQQETEKNVTVKEATTFEATSTPTTAEVNSKSALPSASLPVVAVKPPTVLHKVNDLVNDNHYGPIEQTEQDEQQKQQQQQQDEEANVDNTNNTKSSGSSVSFEANTGNTDEFVALTTILRDNVETMPQKTEATEPMPTSSPPPPTTAPKSTTALNDKTFEVRIQEHCCTATTGPIKLKDEKKPLLKPSVLDAKRSPPLTLKQPLEQICDNETLTTTEKLNTSNKFAYEQENLQDIHNLFKSNTKQNLLTKITKNSDSSSCGSGSANSSPSAKANDKSDAFNFRISSLGCSSAGIGLAKVSTENLFITKAALKAYNSPPATSGGVQTTKNRDHQKPITNSEAAIELKNNSNKNDDNNNAHINTIYTSNRCDNRSQQLNDSTCSSTSYSTPTTSSSSTPATSSRCCSKKRKRLNNNSKTKIIKYANHNKRPGHCYKTNAKALNEATSTKMARTIQSYGKCRDIDTTEMAAAAAVIKKRRKTNKHKLKRLLNKNKTTSNTILLKKTTSPQTQRRKKKCHLQNFRICHKKTIQIEDEMSNTTVSTTTLTSTAFTATSSASSPSTSCSVSSSAAAISSTSLQHLRAITPAAADLVRNSNKTKKGCSSADSLSSSLKACSKMWKTKAAMKANANDMTVKAKQDDDDNHHDADSDSDQPTGNKPQITLPYIETKTAIISNDSSISSSLPSTTSSLSKSLTEIHNSSKNSSDNLSQGKGNHNKVTMSTAVEQDKDINYESKIVVANFKTEKADQKQFNSITNENSVEEIQIATVANDMELKNLVINKESSENPHEEPNKQEDEQEKQVKENSPVKKGSMKLIIQRKRGKRFKCRPKSEDDVPHDNQLQQNHQTKRKRKKSTTHMRNLKCKLENITFIALNNDQAATCLDLMEEEEKDEELVQDQDQQASSASNKVSEFNTGDDENKENPLLLTNNYDVDSDSNVSVYRDPLLLRNETLEEDTPNVTDFVKIPLSIQNECSKETYKLYKEKSHLESPKKLIIRVPLTSLTHDFKRLHLNKDEELENKNELEKTTTDNNINLSEIANEDVEPEVQVEAEAKAVLPHQTETNHLMAAQQDYSSPLNNSSSQSDFMGFSQSTETSSVNSVEVMRYIEPPLCSASSKITDFINDFQNNCIDSSEIEESCDIIPTLGPHITQELSDEIRDVEDTLNGIISEMHDKDMYTPKSAETDEFFNHSLYSPLTDAPTTPSQSFYAESPCTINSNPMSVSPFIHHNMDYNAMTPQSNHSGMGFGSSSSCIGAGGSTGPHTSVYSEHYPIYNECNEETTQSELIGFQNDIPCFENIEVSNGNNLQEIPVEGTEEEQQDEEEEDEEVPNMLLENSSMNIVESTLSPEIEQFVQTQNEVAPAIEQFANIQANDMQEATLPPKVPIVTEHIQPKQFPYTSTNYPPINTTPTFHVQTAAVNPLVPRTTTTQPHYIVTNTNQGQIIIANPTQINSQGREQIVPSFKPHSNNLQYVTLGQAMKATQPATANQLLNNNSGHQWATTVTNATNFNHRPVLTHNNGTTTYFINANGELYQANIPANNLPNPPPVNTTIFVPPNTNQTFNKNRLDNTVPTIQQHPPQQRQPSQNNSPSSQYIMLVNNLNGSPQYYTTTPANNINQTVSPAPQNINTTPTVLIQPAAQVNQNNPSTSTNLQSNIKSDAAPATKSNHIPITPAREPREDLTMRQMINQQLQKQIKQRQLQLLQPRSPNVAQKINLICRFCHKRPKFTNNVDYSNHIISTHPVEKPYNCPSCPTHFTRRSDRQLHVAQVHGTRYQCAQCGLSFCAQRTLDFHLQKYHANMGRSEQLAQLQQQQQRNSSSTTTSATYQLLQHNQQQRLVRVEDVHVQVTGENKNKRSINLSFDNTGADGSSDVQASSDSLNEVEMLSHSNGVQQQERQQKSRKLCCPDCDGDNDDCCGGDSDQNHEQNDINSSSYATQQATVNSNLQNIGNGSVSNHPQQQPQHVTIPSPEQTEPDSTTTLRHFRKRQLCEISTSFTSSSPSPSSSSSSFFLHNNTGNNNGGNDNHNGSDNVLADDGGGEQIVVERTLRGSHNCLLCEESFTNEIALRKHHQLAHGAATQSSMASSSATISSMPLVCTICKRGFRMRNALQRHMETHDAEGRPYECNICQVRFPRPSQLTLHKLTVHKFEKPNSCDECGKKFGTESAMKAHAVEHEKVGAAANATSSSSEASTLLSSSSTTTTTTSTLSQLPSLLHVETITNPNTTTTATISTSNNDQNVHFPSATTSGESSSASSMSANATQSPIVSEIIT